MRNDSPRILSALALLMTMMLGACSPSDRAAPANTSIQIPRDCEYLARDVPIPVPEKAGGAKILLVRTRVALVKANDNLADTRECQAAQRERFARGAVR